MFKFILKVFVYVSEKNIMRSSSVNKKTYIL